MQFTRFFYQFNFNLLAIVLFKILVLFKLYVTSLKDIVILKFRLIYIKKLALILSQGHNSFRIFYKSFINNFQKVLH